MKKFTITIISAILCGLVVLSACGGTKKNVQDAEGQAVAGGGCSERLPDACYRGEQLLW